MQKKEAHLCVAKVLINKTAEKNGSTGWKVYPASRVLKHAAKTIFCARVNGFSHQTNDLTIKPKASNNTLPLYNYTFDKGRLKSLVSWSLKKYGEAKTINLLENLKQTGFYYATKAGISLGVEDLKIPPKKAVLLYEAEEITKKATDQYNRSLITGVERYQCLINTWHRTSEQLKQEVINYFELTDVLNPVYMMAFSGARGNISQVRQLVGMRGLMSNPKGEIIDYPIRSNFREGLTITEYIISSYGARKGIVDTALRTANAGYLTRRLVDVAQHVVISNYDCGTKKGLFLRDIKDGNKTLFSLQNRLLGRVLARDLSKPNANKKGTAVILAKRNQEVDATLAAEIPKHYKKVFVRSALTCETKKLICQLCYGWSLAQGNLVSIGEAVGIVAAQSIGEPGTQLTMRTFHTGGAFSGDITDQIIAPYNGIVKYGGNIFGALTRTFEGKIAFLTKDDGIIEVTKLNSSDTKQFKIPAYTLLYFKPGDSVLEKQVIAQIAASARQASQREDASLVVKSQMQGQLVVQKMEIEEQCSSRKPILEKINTLGNDEPTEAHISEAITGGTGDITFNPILMSKNMAAWDWGYAWILSCNLYRNPMYSHTEAVSFVPMSGDFIDKGSIMSQINWLLPSHGGFKTSFSPSNPASAVQNINKVKNQFGHTNQTIFNKVFIKKNLLALDIQNVVFNKVGYFLTTNKSLFSEKNDSLTASVAGPKGLKQAPNVFVQTNQTRNTQLANAHREEQTILVLPTNLMNTNANSTKFETNFSSQHSNAYQEDKNARRDNAYQTSILKNTLNYLSNDLYPLQSAVRNGSLSPSPALDQLSNQDQVPPSNASHIMNYAVKVFSFSGPSKDMISSPDVISAFNYWESRMNKTTPKVGDIQNVESTKIKAFPLISNHIAHSLGADAPRLAFKKALIHPNKKRPITLFTNTYAQKLIKNYKKGASISNLITAQSNSKIFRSLGVYAPYLVLLNDRLQNKVELASSKRKYKSTIAFNNTVLKQADQFNRIIKTSYLNWGSVSVPVPFDLNKTTDSLAKLTNHSTQKMQYTIKLKKPVSTVLTKNQYAKAHRELSHTTKNTFMGFKTEANMTGRSLSNPVSENLKKQKKANSLILNWLTQKSLPWSPKRLENIHFNVNLFLGSLAERDKQLNSSRKVGTFGSKSKVISSKQIKLTLLQFENMAWYQNQQTLEFKEKQQYLNSSFSKKSFKTPLAAFCSTPGTHKIGQFPSLWLTKHFVTPNVSSELNSSASRDLKSIATGSCSLAHQEKELIWYSNKKSRFNPAANFLVNNSSPTISGQSLSPHNINRKVVRFASNRSLSIQPSIKEYSLNNAFSSTLLILKEQTISYNKESNSNWLAKALQERFLGTQTTDRASNKIQKILFKPPVPGLQGPFFKKAVSNPFKDFFNNTRNPKENLHVPVLNPKELKNTEHKLMDNLKKRATIESTVWNSWPSAKITSILNKQKPSINPVAKQPNSTLVFIPEYSGLVKNPPDGLKTADFASPQKHPGEMTLDSSVELRSQTNLLYVRPYRVLRDQRVVKFTLSCLTPNSNTKIFFTNQSQYKMTMDARGQAQKSSRINPNGSDANLDQTYGSINYYFKQIHFNINTTNIFNILWYSFSKNTGNMANSLNMFYMLLSTYLVERSSASQAAINAPPGRLILAHFNEPSFELSLMFNPKNYKHGVVSETRPKNLLTSFSPSFSSHTTNTHVPVSRTGPCTSSKASWFAANAVNLTKPNSVNARVTRYTVSFGNINYSLMSLAATSFLSSYTGEVLDNTTYLLKKDLLGLNANQSLKTETSGAKDKPLFGFSDYSTLFSIENPVSYIKSQQIKNNQTRCLIVTANDLVAYKLVNTPRKLKKGFFGSVKTSAIRDVYAKETSSAEIIKLQEKWGRSLVLKEPVRVRQENYLQKTDKQTARNQIKIGTYVFKGRTLEQMRNLVPTRTSVGVATHSGQIVGLNNNRVILRKAQPVFVSARSTFHFFHGDFVRDNSNVVTLIYQRLSSGDIVQGIPKVEQFFEARTTKRGRLFRENLPNLLKGLFLKYFFYSWQFLKKVNSSGAVSKMESKETTHGKTWKQNSLKKNNSSHNQIDYTYLAIQWAVQQSFYKIQQIAVDGVLRVYRSQGVSLSDKHLEIIVKQMTTKVRIIRGGQTGFFPGELVDLDFVQSLNAVLVKKILYEPVILGITQASLQVDSFLSAASFQQTSRILSQSALVNKKDFLKGVKENVIVGNLIPTGTGYLVSLNY